MEQEPHSLRDRRVGLDSQPRGEAQRRPLGRVRMDPCVVPLRAPPPRFAGRRGKESLLWWRVERMIVDEGWSPAQASGVLRKDGTPICKQTIYNHVHADPSGRLAGHLPHRLKYNRRTRVRPVTKATNIADRTSIHDRPVEADGTRFGDWEMDTIVDPKGHAILTLTERSINFILMERLTEGRKALPTAKAVARLLFPYCKTLKTITTDNGCEFAAHLEITRRLSLKGREKVVVYFTDAYSSWQKGAIENANKPIRRYIPKQADFDSVTDAKIKAIQHKLNKRPREKLDFFTPKQCFFDNLR